MDFTILTESKILGGGIDDWFGGFDDLIDTVTGLPGALANIADFIGIITQFASGDFSELSSQGSLAGSFSGSGE